jgi:hypothetical protein
MNKRNPMTHALPEAPMAPGHHPARALRRLSVGP